MAGIPDRIHYTERRSGEKTGQRVICDEQGALCHTHRLMQQPHWLFRMMEDIGK